MLFSVSKGKTHLHIEQWYFVIWDLLVGHPKNLFHNFNFDTRVFKIKDDSEDDTQSSSDLSTFSQTLPKYPEPLRHGYDLRIIKSPFDVGRMISEIEDATNDVDNFIVMLTHPDKDHVNLYTDVFGNTQKLSFFGGMWREHSTNEVLEILTNIEKDKIYAVFPHTLIICSMMR